MRLNPKLLSILKHHGQTVTISTGTQSCSVLCIVGTRIIERDARQGGYGNQSAQTLTAREIDITVALTPHLTTATVGQILWRVVSYSHSQADSGVVVITLGPINP